YRAARTGGRSAAALTEQIELLVAGRRVAVRRRRAVHVERPVRRLVAAVEGRDVRCRLGLHRREERVGIAAAAVVGVRVPARGTLRDRYVGQVDGLRVIAEKLDASDRTARGERYMLTRRVC